MIAYLTGEIMERNPALVVLDVAGVGYEVNISLHTYEQIPATGKVRLRIHAIYREDAQQLYGFASEEERALFKQLISVSGVGPNTARTMLSSMAPNAWIDALATGDIDKLKSIKGVGIKTAQRLIVELKGNVEKLHATLSTPSASIQNTVVDEAISAMMVLGYPKVKVEKAVHKIWNDSNGSINIEGLIKKLLQEL